MTGKDVDIGFLEEKDSWLLHPRFFPSKVGGKPSWLDLNNIVLPSDLTCKHCNEVMIFLCQIYAPFEEKDDSFHRTLFIFICKNGPCCRPNNSDNLKVYRCQLPRKNDFYSFEPHEENKNEVFPMDKKHQVLHWQKGHKQNCDNSLEEDHYFTVTESGKSILFKEWELIVDEEDKEDVKNVDTNQEMEKLRKLMHEQKAGTLNDINESELEEYAGNMPEDKVYNKFTKRIAKHPDQVLRYDRGGTPLWITGSNNTIIDVPNCQYCNGERKFEFQIMPQLLNYINVGIDLNSIDWGVLAVYTCKDSCNSGPAYKEEILIKQDLNT
ncbi:unnamed protein product [Leptosia nina]|uniref:Programmed cell death protein 2 C-terminal domain-containing protein n=1 Tax=Leptosia nina TaxID=320188 RepID=A0AAV1JZW8_9NEOP